MLELLLLLGLAGAGYVMSKRSQTAQKSEQALQAPERVKAFSVDDSGVKEDPSAKSRAGVALAASAGQAVPDVLPDGTKVLAVKRTIWGEASTVLQKPDGSIVISVPVYKNGEVFYYEYNVPEEAIAMPPRELNGVKLPDIPPVISISLISSRLNVGELLNKIGVGGITRITGAAAEYMQRWWEDDRSSKFAEQNLHFAYTWSRDTGDIDTIKALAPAYLSSVIENKVRSATNALMSSRAWAEHVGGDAAFNEMKRRELEAIAQKNLTEASLLTDALKRLGVTEARSVDRGDAESIKKAIEASYPERLRNVIQSYNERVRIVNEELNKASSKATAITGQPSVGNSERLFMIALERSGGDPSKFADAIRSFLKDYLSAHPSIHRNFVVPLEESNSPTAPEMLKRIREDPQLRAQYEAYKRALESVRGEFQGRIGIPLEYTTGPIGKLAQAGVDRDTLRMLNERFGDVKSLVQYIYDRYNAVGKDISKLSDWEQKAVYVYIVGLPPESVGSMDIVALSWAGSGSWSGSQPTGYKAQQATTRQTGAGAGYGTGTVYGAETGTGAPQTKGDMEMIGAINRWIKGGMSDAEIMRYIDQWIRTGSPYGQSARTGIEGLRETWIPNPDPCPRGANCLPEKKVYVDPKTGIYYDRETLQPITPRRYEPAPSSRGRETSFTPPPPPQQSPPAGSGDAKVIGAISSWVKGNMSDADVMRAIDSWIKGG